MNALRPAQINHKALKTIKQDIQNLSPHPNKVKIIAVTKTFTCTAIQEAESFGIYNIGENKIQETEKKLLNKKINKRTNLHFIGTLQSNKIKKAIKIYRVIQSVDSIVKAEKINKAATQINKKQQTYLQINIGKDDKKRGFTKENIYESCKKIKKLKNISINGIMTILPQNIKEKTIKKLYLETKKIQEKILTNHFITCTETSMGMSGDYQIALVCGATYIRIGTRLFGKR